GARVGAVERVDVLECAHAGVLHDVLGVVPVAREPARQVVPGGQVRHDELFETSVFGHRALQLTGDTPWPGTLFRPTVPGACSAESGRTWPYSFAADRIPSRVDAWSREYPARSSGRAARNATTPARGGTMSTRDRDRPENRITRRQALACLAQWSGAAVVWTVSGGVPHALGATRGDAMLKSAGGGALMFVQISDTHIGFKKEANPDVDGSLRRAIADINALPTKPAFVVHTGDVSHLSKPEEFGHAKELLQELRVDRVHTIPGEHDTIDDGTTGYLRYFDHDGTGKSWYSFNQAGVHFVGLNNVENFKAK